MGKIHRLNAKNLGDTCHYASPYDINWATPEMGKAIPLAVSMMAKELDSGW